MPWRSAYRTLGLLGGGRRFVLGASGHIAGVVNPAGKNKRSYWAGERATRATPRNGLSRSNEKSGSWWPVLDRMALPAHGRRARRHRATPVMSNIRRSNPRPDATSKQRLH